MIEKMIDINEIKVGDNITTLHDSTVYVGRTDEPEFIGEICCIGTTWTYKVSYCDNDYVILNIGASDVEFSELYILCNYESIGITDECNK
jgi:hypothetical protein